MKYLLITFFLIYLSVFKGIAQPGINFHQSNLPFLGFTYELGERFLTEFRISTDVHINSFSPEIVATYKFIRREDYFFYTGLGGRYNILTSLVVPVGVAIFPFESKKIGFHIEAAPFLGDILILRGSWGIRYRFK
jgi:hypothetical protein